MKASELRIGNYYKALTTGETCKMSLFKFSEWFNDQELDDESTGDYMLPIPLTEEWLVKFGFCKKMASVRHTYSFKKGSVIIGNPLSGGIHYNDIELKSVHQLQNLYYALTGEELEIKNRTFE